MMRRVPAPQVDLTRGTASGCADAAHQRGWRPVAMNFRGCNGLELTSPKARVPLLQGSASHCSNDHPAHTMECTLDTSPYSLQPSCAAIHSVPSSWYRSTQFEHRCQLYALKVAFIRDACAAAAVQCNLH